MDDSISRQVAIDTANEWLLDCFHVQKQNRSCGLIRRLEDLPSAQPEIIRCKDCKYQDENWRRVSVRWLPCMDVRTGSNWYCGSAERRTDE
jgi:hypothetical protein